MSAAFTSRLAGGVLAPPEASFVVAEWADPGGGQDRPMYIAPLHIHHEDDEAWYVLEGTLTVRLGDEDLRVPAGGAVFATHGTPHTYWNPDPRPTRYLLIMTPRIKQLIDALHSLTDHSPETMAATFKRYQSEYLGWP